MKKLILFLVSVLFTVALNAQPCFKFLEHPNDSAIIAACEYYGVRHPKIVLAQAKLETGNYRSKLFKTHKNLFGIRKGKSYVKYDYWWESIIDYRDSIQYKHRKGEDYHAFLQRIGYAEDPSYIQKLKKLS